MPIFPSLSEYTLEVEWLFTWYPGRESVRLVKPRYVSGSGSYESTENYSDVHGLIPVLPFFENAAEEIDNNVGGFINVLVDPRTLVFQVEVEAHIMSARKRKRFFLPPDTTVPFLLNVLSPAGDDTLSHGTGIALQGVVTTGHRFGLSDVVTQVISSLGR